LKDGTIGLEAGAVSVGWLNCNGTGLLE
jgi:hypothetical protein